MPDETWVKTHNTAEKTTSDIIFDWIKNNRQTFYSIVAITIAIVLIIIVFNISYKKNRQIAEKHYFLAQNYYAMGKMEDAIKQIELIEKDYSKYHTYDFALFLKGEIYFTMKDYAKAIKVYKEIMENVKNKDLIPFATYSLAKSYEALKDYNNAINYFNQFIDNFPDHYMLPEVYLSLAVIYKSKGDNEKSKQTFEKIAVLYPQTEWGNIAREYLNELNKTVKKK